jgi:hypothetical protein
MGLLLMGLAACGPDPASIEPAPIGGEALFT